MFTFVLNLSIEGSEQVTPDQRKSLPPQPTQDRRFRCTACMGLRLAQKLPDHEPARRCVCTSAWRARPFGAAPFPVVSSGREALGPAMELVPPGVTCVT